MLTPSDKEIDRLSREAAEQYQPDETISSWEKLEARLDAELGKSPVPPSRRFGRGTIGYSALILLITGASYFLYHQEHKIHSNMSIAKRNNESITKKTNEGSESKPGNSNATEPNVKTNNAGKNGNVEPNHKADPQLDSKTQVSGASNTDANKLVSGVNSGEKNAQGTVSPNKELAEEKGANTTGSTTNTISARKTASGKNGSAVGVTAATTTINNGQPKSNPSPGKKTSNGTPGIALTASYAAGIKSESDPHAMGSSLSQASAQSQRELNISKTGAPESLSNHPPVVNGSLQIDPQSATSLSTFSSGPISNKSAGKSRSLHLNRPLTIGIMVAPDITMVNGIAPDHMSGNIGITLGYQITNRISINTGFISTKKYYAANGSDFHNQMAYPEPDFVKGDCNMYEIPLTLRYNFDAGQKTNFFVNGGLSTYLMHHQSYVYYKSYTGPTGTWNYATEPKANNNPFNYFFSVISLSAGIEHSIGKSLSIQVEPFVKIPLTGMGIGNLNLSSYGVSFSLRYAPLLGKSRH